MEPLEYFDALERLFGVNDAIREHIQKAKTNSEQCQTLQKHVDALMKPAARMRHKAVYSEQLKVFIEEMTSILGSTESVVRGLTKVNIAQRVIMTRKYENQLNALMRKLTEIHNSPAFQNLKRAYSEKPWVSAKFATTWELPFSGACTFCHVTLQGLIVVGGQCAGKENMHQIRAYDPFGNYVWHWQCLEEIGQPSDITQVTLKGPRKETVEYLAIVSEDEGKVFLFDPEIRSIVPDAAYTATVPEYRLRRIARLVAPQRVAVSLDPAITVSADCNSIVILLNCDSVPFTEIRKISVACIDTHVLSPISHVELAVLCRDHVTTCNVEDETTPWQLRPEKVEDVQVCPQTMCAVGGDLVVFDSADSRLVSASSGKWGNRMLRGLGSSVYSMAWHAEASKIVVLHHRDGAIRVTLFDALK